MKHPGYGEQIVDIVKSKPYGVAIYQDDVARELVEKFEIPLDQAKKITNINLKRLADKEELERLQKGIYYRTKQTIFGKAKPSMEAVATRILTKEEGDIIGYETGASFRNRLGLLSLLPRDKEIVTNGYRKQIGKKSHIIPKRPITRITRDNYKYFQILDVIKELKSAYIDVDNPEEIVSAYIKRENLDKIKLIYLARRFYPVKTVLQLIDIIVEDKDEITR